MDMKSDFFLWENPLYHLYSFPLAVVSYLPTGRQTVEILKSTFKNGQQSCVEH